MNTSIVLPIFNRNTTGTNDKTEHLVTAFEPPPSLSNRQAMADSSMLAVEQLGENYDQPFRTLTISRTVTMLGLAARFQRQLFASRRSCLRFQYNFSASSSPHQVIQNVDDECTDFMTWLRNKSGAEISSVLSIGKSNYGRSLFACKPIRAGDCIFKVPLSVAMAPDNLDPSIDSLLGKDVNDFTKLTLTILQHKRLGQASEWAPYLNFLPLFADMHSTLFWSDEELQMIKESFLYDVTLNHKAQIEKTFTSVKHVLFLFPEYFEGVSLHEFKHAYNLVESRSWMTPRGPSMIPFADFLNHDANTEQLITFKNTEQVIKLTAVEDYAPGDEVLVTYGRLENISLLLTFGFVLPDNRYDNPTFKIYAPQHDPLLALKRDLFNRSLELGSVAMKESSWSEIPETLRALARVLCCTSQEELQELAIEAAQNEGRLARIPLKNRDKELEAHQFLHSKCVQSIDNLHAALKPLSHLKSGNETRRMQIARDLLNGELRMFKSASAWLKGYCEALKQTGSVETEVIYL
ncbi:hypothetical protein QVD17_36064 [Tagetes erecta]|uniref:SET domain-containing protein n=1 Tax=Tagetes erecta TaxID=13708 RepID=A0AAD8JTD3_TARER|nr:hypothetical protein QVD17_36064 [Tagetes erecta]